MLTRRSLLKTVPLVLTSLGHAATARATVARPTRRYIVQIVLAGGVDAQFFTDPKERSEVDRDVDVPVAPKDILTRGNARFGPLFEPLMKWLPKLTVVNGVVLATANHPAGLRQLLRFRSGATDEMPLAVDLIGADRDGAALPSVSLGGGIGLVFMPDTINPSVLRALDKTPPEDLRRMARLMRTRARAIEGVGDRATTASIEATAQFFERIAEASPFQPRAIGPARPPRSLLEASAARTKPSEASKPPPKRPNLAPSEFERDLQRTVWLLKHDLTRGVILGAGNWDSHTYNTWTQEETTNRHFPAIVDFLTSLEATKNQHGSLFDNTLVVIGSELGRFPVLNSIEGKDHFPEAPFVFVNAPGGGGNVFGRTGKRMQALPFAKRRSGKIGLTDIGMSVLRIGGVDPEALGYDGEPLDFLEA